MFPVETREQKLAFANWLIDEKFGDFRQENTHVFKTVVMNDMATSKLRAPVLLLHHAVIVLLWSARCWLQSSLATRQRTHTRAAPTASHTRPDRAPSTPCVPRTATHTHNTEHKQTPGNQTVSHIHIKAVGGWVLESTASPATTARSRSAALPARRCLPATWVVVRGLSRDRVG